MLRPFFCAPRVGRGLRVRTLPLAKRRVFADRKTLRHAGTIARARREIGKPCSLICERHGSLVDACFLCIALADSASRPA